MMNEEVRIVITNFDKDKINVEESYDKYADISRIDVSLKKIKKKEKINENSKAYLKAIGYWKNKYEKLKKEKMGAKE